MGASRDIRVVRCCECCWMMLTPRMRRMMSERPPPHRTHLHVLERKAVIAPPSCLRVCDLRIMFRVLGSAPPFLSLSLKCGRARNRRSLHSDFTRYGLSLPPSPVREGLLDDPTGDLVEQILSQTHGEPPVERWEELLQSLHDAPRAHLRAARVPATRGAASSFVAARGATPWPCVVSARAPPADQTGEGDYA